VHMSVVLVAGSTACYCETWSLLLDNTDVFVMAECTLFARIAGSSSNRIIHAGRW
jgi:hypothetical protein